MTAYSPIIKAIARYLSTQYPSKNSANRRNSKKEDRSGKNGDDPKSEDKDSNTAGTAGVHVWDTTPHEESTASNRRASISTHILKANEQLSRPTRSVEDILEAHPINDDNFLEWDKPKWRVYWHSK